MSRHASPPARPPARAALAVIRGGYGVLQLASPTLVSGRLAHARLDARGQAVARVLGARQLAQALASGPVPGYPVLALGVEVDLLHAASMLALAFDGRRRRAALADALIAGGFALAGALAARKAAQDPHRSRAAPCKSCGRNGRTASPRHASPATRRDPARAGRTARHDS